MSESKHPHCPGPWAVDDDLNVYSEVSGAMICKVFEADDFPCLEEGTEGDVQAECEANARTLAAAPDLLASVTELVAAMHRYEVEVEGDAPRAHLDMMDRARAAISKAGEA